MEKCGVCAHITNEFVVIPEAKPREIPGADIANG